jgi:hypothetical protein
MPHPRSALDALGARLRADMVVRPPSPALPWGDPRAMGQALRALRRALGDADTVMPANDVMQESLRRFAAKQDVPTFTELKYVCYGVTIPIGDSNWRIIDRPPLFEKLIRLVESRQAQPKQFRRCYQGLLSGYFGYARDEEHEATGSTKN